MSRALRLAAAIALLPLGCQRGHQPPVPDPAPLARVTVGESRREALVQALAPGQRVVLADLRGPGVIRHMWFTARSDHAGIYAGLVLRIWWDGEAHPSVEVPLGDFFGVGFGEERLVLSGAVEMIPCDGLPGHAALNCWLPMPFETARIEIENQHPFALDQLFHIINWERVPAPDAEVGRFHAVWRRSNPVARGRPHTVLQAWGEGHFVGMVLSIRRLEKGSWVEGGEDFYIDVDDDAWAALKAWDRKRLPLTGARIPEEWVTIANQPMGPVWPTLMGIGGEDYFGQSWGFRRDASAPLHGVSLGPDDADRMTAYRFHLPDPVRFHRNLWVTFRNHGWDTGPRADDVTTVAYWYQIEPHSPAEPLPPLEERLPVEKE